MTSPSPCLIAFAGNPNVGKSTLFNRLTGSHQKIGNFSGVTVEKKIGVLQNSSTLIIDLPGTYSLDPNSDDERIAVDCILGHSKEIEKLDAIAVIVEATNIQRGLYLFKQIQAVHPNIWLIINMMDEFKNSGMSLDIPALEKKLGVPVFPISARSGAGIQELEEKMRKVNSLEKKSSKQNFEIPRGEAVHAAIHRDLQNVLSAAAPQKSLTDKIDNFLLHPILGPILFLFIMLLLFQSLFSWSAPLTDSIDTGISWISDFVASRLADSWIKSLIIDGVIAGVGSVIIFVPQIAITFLFIGFLEGSGYLARGAFLMDRWLRMVGLEGRAFIPLLSSFACAVPGIMATRSIPNSRQRLITILIAPLMTCSARLPVYTLVIATFIPNISYGFFNLPGLVLFALFLLGIVSGFLVSWILNKVLPGKKSCGFFVELPRYRLPQISQLAHFISIRLQTFLKNAGTTIFILSLILWALAYFPRSAKTEKDFSEKISAVETNSQLNDNTKNEQIAQLENERDGTLLRHSYMGSLGQVIEPVIKPLGMDWRLGIGLIASFAAREVFVSTLGITFSLGETDENSSTLREKLLEEHTADGKPLYTLATAAATLVFFALSAQCISTLAAIKRETGSWKWPAVTFTYMTLLAYTGAWIAAHLVTIW